MIHFENAIEMLFAKKYDEAQAYVKKHNRETNLGVFLVTNPIMYNKITTIRPLLRSLWVDKVPLATEFGLAANNIEYIQYCIDQRVNADGTDWFVGNESDLASAARIMGRISIAEEIEKGMGISF